MNEREQMAKKPITKNAAVHYRQTRDLGDGNLELHDLLGEIRVFVPLGTEASQKDLDALATAWVEDLAHNTGAALEFVRVTLKE